MNINIKYDRFGRMKYNPLFHQNTGKRWNDEDLNYLIKWYDIIGPEEMSFALERTVNTVMTKAWELRKKGVMEQCKNKVRFKRMIH